MSQNKILAKITLIAVVLSSLISCRYEDELNEIKSLQQQKEEVLELGDFEINKESQEILMKYFERLERSVNKYKNSSKLQKYSKKYFDKYFDEKICGDVLLAPTEYEFILSKCTINEFFLCADEVRRYRNNLTQAIALADQHQIEHLKSEDRCTEILVNLENDLNER